MQTVSHSERTGRLWMTCLWVTVFAMSSYIGLTQSEPAPKVKVTLKEGIGVEGEFRSEESGLSWPGMLRVTRLDAKSGILLGEVELVFDK